MRVRSIPLAGGPLTLALLGSWLGIFAATTEEEYDIALANYLFFDLELLFCYFFQNSSFLADTSRTTFLWGVEVSFVAL